MTQFSTFERQLLDDNLQSLLEDTYGFAQWQIRCKDQGTADDRSPWRSYAELGWLGVALPESVGGSGGGMTELGIVMAACGRHMALEPLIGTIVLGSGAIDAAGTEDQKADLLKKIAAGDLTLAFCHAEPHAGYARDFVETIAQPTGDGYVLDGRKTFSIGAQCADKLIISARIGSLHGPVGLFLVTRQDKGVTLNVAPALDARLGATVELSATSLAGSALLGEDHSDRLELIDHLIDLGAIAACAEACGAMAEATQLTVNYCKIRQQFGQPLSKFQVLQHRLVDMNIACEEARAIVHAALEALDSGSAGAQRFVWLAKVQTALAARFVGAQSLQLHGGVGMTDAVKVGHLYKRLCVCEALFGDADWYLRCLAETVPRQRGVVTERLTVIGCDDRIGHDPSHLRPPPLPA